MADPKTIKIIKSAVIGIGGWLLIVMAAQAAESLATVTVSYHPVQDEQVLDGVVEAVQRSTVAAELVGRIEEINFDVDDFVPKGSVLVRFRDNEQRARLAQAEANQKEAKARLVEARQEYRRVKNLVAKKLASQSNMDSATAALDSAEARVKAADAQIKVAQEQFDRTVVKAPYSGYVVARHVEVGETVGVGQPLMTGMSLDDLRVAVQVPQSFINTVRAHDEATVRFPGEGLPAVTAQHLTVFPFADPISHTVKVRIPLPKDFKGARPGTFVKAAFIIGESRRLLVPAQAVIQRSELTAVYVMTKDGRIALRQVRIGQARDNNMLEVLAGLQEGETVVLDPVQAGLALKERQADHEQ